ncbi:MAG: hypothetical protein ABSF98_00685 [Bryobacteraceae bacterium]
MANEAAEPIYGRVHDLAFDLVKEASALAASLQPKLGEAVADVVRLANARYSGVIDGDAVEAAAYAGVEKRIDTGGADLGHPASVAFLGWVYRELYGFDGLAVDLTRFEDVYTAVPGRFRQVLAVPASYHRLLQIHPFAHGNGPVARLMAHAELVRLEIGGLWSLSRALARELPRYRELAAVPGESDETGIFGNQALMDFCRFFLATAIDEVRWMRSLLDPVELLGRVEAYCHDERDAGRLPEGCYAVLREVILRGELPRAEVASIVPFRERKARQISSRLRERGLLVSSGVRAALRPAFPEDVVARWFPGLDGAELENEAGTAR